MAIGAVKGLMLTPQLTDPTLTNVWAHFLPPPDTSGNVCVNSK